MQLTLWTGIAVLALHTLLNLTLIIGAMMRKTFFLPNEGISFMIFMLFASFGFTGLGILTAYTAPHVWGIGFGCVVFVALTTLLPYQCLRESLILGKRYIYRLNPFLIPLRHSYKDVIGYCAKTERGVHVSRGGSRIVKSYVFTIYFADGSIASIDFNDHTSTRVRHLKERLKEHNCKQNGRIGIRR